MTGPAYDPATVPDSLAAEPDPPEDPRDFLHLLAIDAWRGLASGRTAPDLDALFLGQEIRDLFDEWLEAARESGITVEDEDGDILPAVTRTLMPVLTAAFWSGLTTGHHAIAGSRLHVPRRLMPYCGGQGGGSR